MRAQFQKCRAKNCPNEKTSCRRYTQDASKKGQMWVTPRFDEKGKCPEYYRNFGAK